MKKKIILASGSKARQALLKQIGLRFSVISVDVKEKKNPDKGCAALVKENAARKAKEASKIAKGIIIAADTVVFADGKIIGKPEDKKDAKKTLKLLSRRPQWVYTAVAVINTETGKMYIDFEKTKIYMREMTNKEINGYFKKVSPLDKAGSFDIQGPGAIFIDRIEGCFYNVIGIPLSKLVSILKKFGVDIYK